MPLHTDHQQNHLSTPSSKVQPCLTFSNIWNGACHSLTKIHFLNCYFVNHVCSKKLKVQKLPIWWWLCCSDISAWRSINQLCPCRCSCLVYCCHWHFGVTASHQAMADACLNIHRIVKSDCQSVRNYHPLFSLSKCSQSFFKLYSTVIIFISNNNNNSLSLQTTSREIRFPSGHTWTANTHAAMRPSRTGTQQTVEPSAPSSWTHCSDSHPRTLPPITHAAACHWFTDPLHDF